MHPDDNPIPAAAELGALRSAVDSVQRELDAAEQSLRDAGVASSGIRAAMDSIHLDVTVLKKELAFLTERLDALRNCGSPNPD